MDKYYSHNRLLVPAIAGVEVDGEQLLSVAAQCRADRAVQEYHTGGFKGGDGTILIASGLNMETEPNTRAPHMMARYMMRQFGIPESVILIEDESNTPKDFFELAQTKYRSFFNNTTKNKKGKELSRKIGFVSRPDQLPTLIAAGAFVLCRTGNWYQPLPTTPLDCMDGEQTVSRYAQLVFDEEQSDEEQQPQDLLVETRQAA